jgi:hypothetical protein
MRVLVALLIAVGVVYIWDVNYNNSFLSDGVMSMLRSMSHSMR